MSIFRFIRIGFFLFLNGYTVKKKGLTKSPIYDKNVGLFAVFFWPREKLIPRNEYWYYE